MSSVARTSAYLPRMRRALWSSSLNGGTDRNIDSYFYVSTTLSTWQPSRTTGTGLRCPSLEGNAFLCSSGDVGHRLSVRAIDLRPRRFDKPDQVRHRGVIRAADDDSIMKSSRGEARRILEW